MTNYYCIHILEDDVCIEKMTKEQILKELNEENMELDILEENIFAKSSLNSIYTSDLEVHKSILIKGEIIFPKPIKKVTKWEID